MHDGEIQKLNIVYIEKFNIPGINCICIWGDLETSEVVQVTPLKGRKTLPSSVQ